MNILLVTFDLSDPVESYQRLLRELEELDAVELSETCYAVATALSPEQLLSLIGWAIDEDDQICIIMAAGPWTFCGRPHIRSWLEKRLRSAPLA